MFSLIRLFHWSDTNRNYPIVMFFHSGRAVCIDVALW